MRMSRDARQLYNYFDTVRGPHGIQSADDPRDIMIMDITVARYFPTPLINILKGRVKTVRKMEPKHTTMEYWLPVVANMCKQALRPDAPAWVKDINPDAIMIQHATITQSYLLTDYSHEDLLRLLTACGQFTLDQITRACGIGRSNNVYDIRYIVAVMEKDQAIKQVQDEKVRQIDDRARESDRLLGEVIHTHTPLDMAQVEYNWQNMMENAEIERKLAEVMKRM